MKLKLTCNVSSTNVPAFSGVYQSIENAMCLILFQGSRKRS